MLNLSVAAAEEDIDLESFGKKKKKKKVTIEDDEEGGGEKDDGAVDGELLTVFLQDTIYAFMLYSISRSL